MNQNVIITPIANREKKEPFNIDGTRKPDSRRDYSDQLYREYQGFQMMWDDAKTNNAKVDDIILFYEYNNEVNVRKVLHISNEIDPIWPNRFGHQNRQVLYLSLQLHTYFWDDWVNINGYTHIVRDTMYVNRDKLKNNILQRFN